MWIINPEKARCLLKKQSVYTKQLRGKRESSGKRKCPTYPRSDVVLSQNYSAPVPSNMMTSSTNVKPLTVQGNHLGLSGCATLDSDIVYFDSMASHDTFFEKSTRLTSMKVTSPWLEVAMQEPPRLHNLKGVFGPISVLFYHVGVANLLSTPSLKDVGYKVFDGEEWGVITPRVSLSSWRQRRRVLLRECPPLTHVSMPNDLL